MTKRAFYRSVIEPGVFGNYKCLPFLGARLSCGHLKLFRGMARFNETHPPTWFKFPKTTECDDCRMALKGRADEYLLLWSPKAEAKKLELADRAKVANEISRSLNFVKADPDVIGQVVRAFLGAHDGATSPTGEPGVTMMKVTREYHDALCTRADRWVPANGGQETPQTHDGGHRLLYVFNFALGKHAYLDCNTDTILTQDEVNAILFPNVRS